MDRIWQVIPHDADLVEKIEQACGISPVIAQLLAARGITDRQEIQKFLTASMANLHDPGLLPGNSRGAEVVYEAVASGKKIVIFGDYDCDGMSGTAILVNGLKLLGADVAYHIPNRLEDGYGLNTGALEALKQRGHELLVTVDCGVASIEEVEYANKIGLEIVVTDHHEMRDRLPSARAVIHPKLDGSAYPLSLIHI